MKGLSPPLLSRSRKVHFKITFRRVLGDTFLLYVFSSHLTPVIVGIQSVGTTKTPNSLPEDDSKVKTGYHKGTHPPISHFVTERLTQLHHYHNAVALYLRRFPRAGFITHGSSDILISLLLFSQLLHCPDRRRREKNPTKHRPHLTNQRNDGEIVSIRRRGMILNPHHISSHTPGSHFQVEYRRSLLAGALEPVPVATHSSSYPLFFPSPPVSISHCSLHVLLLLFSPQHPTTTFPDAFDSDLDFAPGNICREAVQLQ